MTRFLLVRGVACVSSIAAVATASTVEKVWGSAGVRHGRDIRKVNSALTVPVGVAKAFTTLRDVRITFDDAKVDSAAIKAAVARAGPYELVEQRGAVAAASQ